MTQTMGGVLRKKISAVETGGYTLKAIAGCFGVHYATVSRAAGRTKP